MAEKYLTRLEERANLRDEALLQKVRKYRGSASQTTKEDPSTHPEQRASVGSKFTKLMIVAISILWVNSFMFPIFSVFLIAILFPIYKNTQQGDNWRYGADFISGLAILFSIATIIKAAI